MPAFSYSFSSAFSRIELPYLWSMFQLPAVKICGLLAQVGILRGETVEYRTDGSLSIGGRDLVGPAGKTYRFKTEESAAAWEAIARERALSELKLSRLMDLERRAVWLGKKSARLADDAERKVLRAQSIADQDTRNALIADAGFALVKWAHYG